jgi:neutral ceramidase
MHLGCSEVNITPHVPIHLDGYYQRQEPARGIASPLHARAFVFSQGGLSMGIITADLLMLDREQAWQVRAEAGKLTGIKPANIIISCSHTHSGPAPTSFLGNPPDPKYINWLLKALAGALLQAWDNQEEVRVGFASTQVEGVGANRRNPEEAADQELIVLGFRNKAGALKALLFNFACHPTVLGADNLRITPDYPGAAVAVLKKLFPGTVAGFINGACGDISTRFTRREQTHAEAERLGAILGAAAASLAAGLSFADADLAAQTITLPVAAKQAVEPAQAQAEIARWQGRLAELQRAGAPAGELRQAQTNLEGALFQKELKKVLATLERDVQLCLWRIGGLGLVTIPGELFSGLGRAIKDQSPFMNTIIAGYSNGYINYIPHREAYRQGGYEALLTPLAPGFGENLVSAAVQALWALGKE